MDDLISRQAAIKILRESEEYDADIPNRADGVRDAIIDIMSLPTIEERKKGKWIYRPEIGWGEAWACSECEEITKSTIMGKPRYNYCPNCGADMRTSE